VGLKNINLWFDPVLTIVVSDSNWKLIGTATRGLYVSGPSQIVYIDDPDYPVTPGTPKRIKRAWCITKSEVTYHDDDHYNYGEMKTKILVDKNAMQKNYWPNGIYIGSNPICYVTTNDNTEKCKAIDILGPCLYVCKEENKKENKRSLWIETNSELKLFKDETEQLRMV